MFSLNQLPPLNSLNQLSLIYSLNQLPLIYSLNHLSPIYSLKQLPAIFSLYHIHLMFSLNQIFLICNYIQSSLDSATTLPTSYSGKNILHTWNKRNGQLNTYHGHVLYYTKTTKSYRLIRSHFLIHPSILIIILSCFH